MPQPNSALESLRETRTDHSDRDNYRGRGRGSYINYYKDLGFSTSAPAYENWRKEEDLFQQYKAKDLSIIEQNRQQLAGAEAQYNSYTLDLPTLPGLQESWDAHRATLVPVKVVSYKEAPDNYDPRARDGDTGETYTPSDKPPAYDTEGIYYLPKEYIPGITGSNMAVWQDGDSYLVSTHAGGKTFGQEIHNYLRDLQGKYESEYKTYAAGELNNAQSALNEQTGAFNAQKQEAWDNISNYRNEISAAEARVNAAQQLRNEQLADLQGRYQQRLNTLKDLFSGKSEEK